MRFIYIVVVLLFILLGCKDLRLVPVTNSDFQQFVIETSYITDAEKFGWSIVQLTVDSFNILYGIDWRCPNGLDSIKADEPVRQVSYNDALAYAEWADVELPNYQSYWELTQSDQRAINENSPDILPLDQVNLVGNLWEITKPDALGRIRLAGGSYLCNKNSCNGTSPDRQLYVDKITGNVHISFAILK